MKNLIEALCEEGLSDTEARQAMQVVLDWVEERYPALAHVAKNTVIEEFELKAEGKEVV
ncbi:MAG TPA: hypothetical protein VF609_03330 [Flavisolibacter sp.]|jgi:hypothetical protein